MAAVALVLISICTGICPAHPPLPPIPVVGIIITGSPDHTIEGSAVASSGISIVVCNCGHSGVIISSLNPTNLTNGLPKASVGSLFTGVPTGVVITGSLTAS